ncbi:MAG: AI-2E family transporter [Oscillospiraceae bacterium]|nr:AI-2E family transporter [Oscillospiraceae bacterium]
MKKTRREPIVLSQMHPFTLFLVLSGCIVVVFALIRIDSVAKFCGRILSALGPVFTGCVFAFLLVPAANLTERRIAKIMARAIEKHPRMKSYPRCIGSFLVVLVFVSSIVLLVAATFSQVVDGVSRAIDQLPHYFDLVTEHIGMILSADNNIARYLSDLSDRFSASQLGMGSVDTVDVTQRLLSAAASGAAGTFSFLYDVIVGFVVAVYVLVSRDRFFKQWKQILYAVCKPKTAAWINSRLRIANQTFGTAAIGKLIDSVLIGLFCFIGCSVIRTPYSTLIAVIIGVTNMIPYFGPIFGAIPCVLLILMESPPKALYFVIFIIALQQFDANILDPRIVGKSIGLPAFWELFACLLGGGLFGIVGLIIGVPAFAVVYTLVKQLVSERLSDRVKEGELTPEFLREQLGVTEVIQESGLFSDDESDSPYIQHLILLEDIAQQPHINKDKPE